LSALNPKPFLRTDDIDEPTDYVVEDFGQEKVWIVRVNKEELKPVLYLRGEDRYFIFNVTNQKIVGKSLGIEYVDDLIGKTIRLYVGPGKNGPTIYIDTEWPPQQAVGLTLESAMDDANREIGPDENGTVYFQDAAHFANALTAAKFDLDTHGRDAAAWEKARAFIVKGAIAKRARAARENAVTASAQVQPAAETTEDTTQQEPVTQ
jgi:hypothetical protein